MQKRLYRSKENKVLAGVLGGLGEYLEIDPVILRVIWLAITVFTGLIPGIVVYVLAILVIPPHGGAISLPPAAGTNQASEASDTPKT